MTYNIEIREGNHIVTMLSREEYLIKYYAMRLEIERIFAHLFETVRETIENAIAYYREVFSDDPR